MAQQSSRWGPDVQRYYMHHYKLPAVFEPVKPSASARQARERSSTGRCGARSGPVCRARGIPVRDPRQVGALSSNGSSMGSVCASTLALLNAGVPLRRRFQASRWAHCLVRRHRSLAAAPSAGSLRLPPSSRRTSFGDMDFKVAVTKAFVNPGLASVTPSSTASRRVLAGRGSRMPRTARFEPSCR